MISAKDQEPDIEMATGPKVRSTDRQESTQHTDSTRKDEPRRYGSIDDGVVIVNNDDVCDETDEVMDDADHHQEDEEEEILKRKRRSCYTKVLVGLLLLGFIAYVIYDSVTSQHIKKGIITFLEWIKDNPGIGVVLFIILYFFATILFVPGSILTLGAGFTFSATFGLGIGVALGSVAVFIGAALGSIVAFLLARFLLREQVQGLTTRYAVFEAIDSALEGNGLKIFILLRLSPIIPFNAINYVAGVTAVPFRDYTLALFAMIPGTVLFIFLGASAGSLAESANSGSDPTITIVVTVVGTVLGIGTVWLTTGYAKKELNRILEERRLEQAEEEVGVDHSAAGDALVAGSADVATTTSEAVIESDKVKERRSMSRESTASMISLEDGA